MAPGHALDLVWAGAAPANAAGALVLVHGRGADARDILDLAPRLGAADLTWVAPRATRNTWYPHSFLAPIGQNEPWLSSALDVIDRTLEQVREKGIADDHVYFCGFSQGACLLSEFLVRNARRYGGALVFTGGVIGPAGAPRSDDGRFEGMPVFLSCGDADRHVPLWRVDETAALFDAMGARVTRRIYPGRPHTIVADEIEQARRLLRR